jgi:hypothetical protein
MTLQEEITELTNEWYNLIGGNHHKDRDCHFYIKTKWSYGKPPVYFVEHFGYIVHDYIEIEYKTYDEALVGLRDKLKEIIEEQRKWIEE